MNFQQLRYVRETVRRGLSLTEAANALHTSQPGVSKQVRELENELGFEIFVRHGKRIAALTEPGKAVLEIIERVLLEAENLKRAADDFRDQEAGSLTIATTHTQARYALPRVVTEFKRRYPRVRLTMQQANPPQLAEMVLAGAADIAVASEALDDCPGLLAMPAYTWNHCAVVPSGHALLKAERLTLEALARHPIVTYDPAFSGRANIDAAFAAARLEAEVVLSAIDADVIKTYAELGLGVGIIAAMAFDERRDSLLRAIDCAHLFRSNTTRVAVKRGSLLRGYAFAFIELFAPTLTRQTVQRALAGGGELYEL
ncbi:MAG: CysB family HTH-type transcriptional regulator [Betaproteobacteria bacterium]|nr:CysB family HTH-type transcriptional regulator [Betaproteobacteria bacterium]MBI2959487.1 CysB family HTH-type transcriptional regulator [Betaproteobacteria bacterium]